MVYIREAHPTDGWQTKANEREGILFEQPTSLLERAEVAHAMCEALKLKLPPLLDTLDDQANNAYSAWPDRLYLVGVDGNVAFKGKQGPAGFRPDELEKAIEKELSGEAGEVDETEGEGDR